MKKIAIIGCGASGTMVLANLIKQATPGTMQVSVFHEGTPLARGIAYSTPVDGHLLNVTADDMGMWEDNKNDFFEWLEQNYSNKYHKKSFVPRKIFGEYLVDRLNETLTLAKAKGIQIDIVEQNVTKLPEGFDHICLALGNKLKQFKDEEQIDPAVAKHIVIAGTGLSMIDVVVWLDEQNYRGKISLISTHGKLPHPYSLDTKVAVTNTVEVGDSLSCIIEKYNKMVEKYGDWRSVIDSFRPITNQIWQAWSLADRQEFLSKHNSEWGVRRHKIAREIHDRVQNFFNKTEVETISARINKVTKVATGYVVELANSEQITCDGVANCMGLDLNPRSHLIYNDLITNGILEVSAVGSGVIPSKQAHLHIIGSALIGHLFESVAIPDLRGQAKSIASQILN